MSWVKFTDCCHSDPKILAAGDFAVGFFLRACTYSADHNLYGFVPKEWAHMASKPAQRQRLLHEELLVEVSEGETFDATVKREKSATTDRFVALTMPSDGYYIVKYHKYNPSSEQDLRSAEQNRNRQRRHREKERRDAAKGGTGNADRNGVTGEGRYGVTGATCNASPVPLPRPVGPHGSSDVVVDHEPQLGSDPKEVRGEGARERVAPDEGGSSRRIDAMGTFEEIRRRQAAFDREEAA